MQPRDPSRREFGLLASAALGGLLAGMGVAGAEDKEEKDKDKKDKEKPKKNPLLSDKHVCRGLNTCKNKGKGKNDCAGQGDCATAKAHTCKGDNECRGQGGCGAKPGENECKGKGECAVPLSDKAWKKARERFEELAKAEKIKFGPAPKKK
jgi:hypothetical protein